MKLPQLSLRELFLLVALAAMGCGWWVQTIGLNEEAARLKARTESLQRVVEQVGMSVTWEDDWVEIKGSYLPIEFTSGNPIEPTKKKKK